MVILVPQLFAKTLFPQSRVVRISPRVRVTLIYNTEVCVRLERTLANNDI